MLFLLSIPAKNPIRRFGWKLLPKVTALLKDSLEFRKCEESFKFAIALELLLA